MASTTPLPTRTHRRRLAAAVVTLLMAGPFAAACDSSTDKPTTTSLTHVVYLTGASASGREGFVEIASQKGFFREAGLEVEVRIGGAGDKNLSLLLSDKAHYALIDYTGGLARAGTGKFGDFVFTAAVNQGTIISLLALEGRGINNERDLAGKTIATAPGAVPQTMFPAYANLAKIDTTAIKFRNLPFPQLTNALLAGQVDAIGVFTPGIPQLEDAVKKANLTVPDGAGGTRRPAVIVLDYGRYIRDSYGNAVVTTKKRLAQDPEQVRKFTKALLKGLRWSVQNPDAAGEIIGKKWKEVDPQVAAAELRVMANTIGTPEIEGRFDRSRVTKSVALAQSLKLMPSPADPVTFPDTFIDFSVLGPAPSTVTGGTR